MHNQILLLDRPNLGEALVTTLRNRIVNGRLPAGKRLNEVHLASSLGVSRTPLREALGRLAAEGALTAVPRIGYFVRPLTLDEFGQIYSIRALLDPEALRLAGLPSPQRLSRLRRLNRAILKATGANNVISLDDTWHLELVAACPNRVLIDLIQQFMRRTRRYEIALMREKRNVHICIADHAKIIAALRTGELESACLALRRNMQSGIEPIVAWLKARESAPLEEKGGRR
jgi:DNA-binding GntR family transcriptional regulator